MAKKTIDWHAICLNSYLRARQLRSHGLLRHAYHGGNLCRWFLQTSNRFAWRLSRTHVMRLIGRRHQEWLSFRSGIVWG